MISQLHNCVRCYKPFNCTLEKKSNREGAMDAVGELEPSAQVEEFILARSTHCPQKSRRDRQPVGTEAGI